MIGINAGIGQGWRLRMIIGVRRAICAVAERRGVITCLEAHAVVTVVAAVRSGQAIVNDVGWGMRGEGGGEGWQVIGFGCLSRLACLPECSPKLFTFARLVL